MKITNLLINTISSIVLPLLAYSEDPAEPGKTSDAVKNPPAATPSATRDLTPAERGDREPGKSSDSVREPSPTSNERQFSGRITSVSRSDNTITVNDQTTGSQVLHIGETTKMKRGTAGASWDDLKVGENVQGMMRTDGTRANASSIEIGK
jgi:hypothetical protein